MAKRPNTQAPATDLFESNEALLELAEMLLSDFFFNPDNEQLYKRTMAANRPSGTDGAVLDEDVIELPDGICKLRIEALRALTRFRIAVAHPAFTATVEGTWSFENETLSRARCTRTGDAEAIESAVEAIIEVLDGADDEEFAELVQAF